MVFEELMVISIFILEGKKSWVFMHEYTVFGQRRYEEFCVVHSEMEYAANLKM
jgi:hypothetical protein